jgi:uncharacterized protein
MFKEKIMFTFVRVVCLASLAMFVSTAQAVSFDCQKAKTFIEKAVCQDPALSDLDDELGALYQSAIDNSSTPAANALKKQQLQWLKQRDTCQTNACVKKAYQKRIIDLNP